MAAEQGTVGYRERVRSPGWVVPAVGVIGGLWTARRLRRQAQQGAPGWRRALGAINAVMTAMTLLRFARRLANVAVEVDDELIRVAFGPFEHRIAVRDVRDVRVVTYNPVRYLGWGYRIGLGGRRAYSQVGIPRGVEIAAQEDGHFRRYFVSSREPEALASAIATVAGAGVSL